MWLADPRAAPRGPSHCPDLRRLCLLRPARRAARPRTPGGSAQGGSVVGGVVEPGQPGGEPFDGHLELRVEVDELLHAVGEPGHRDLLVATPLKELLDAPVGEVHLSRTPAPGAPSAPPCACSPGRPPVRSTRDGTPG